MNLGEQLKAQAAVVEDWLDQSLPEPADASASRLVEAMRYSLQAGGKRLRPVLCAWTCAAVAGEVNASARAAAVALEMLHTYSLIHDDLPAMDDDDVRRGRPSCHRAFDEATAILAGDALQTAAFATLAELDDAAAARDLARWLARASGIGGMACGQQLDLDGTGVDADPVAVEHTHRLKTGALLAASLCMGARAGGMAQQELEPLYAAGQELGVAFQITDDVLDRTADPVRLGKSVGKDLRQGKQTALAASSVEHAMATARVKVQDALGVMDGLG
ncbi:hypothetical protein DRQ32_05000, partial [bacterium]